MKLSSLLVFRRAFSNASKTAMKEPASESSHPRMTGWQIHSYGELDELQFSKNLKKPFIKSPSELLVKINASSINPIDVAMMNGYGSTLFNKIRYNSGNIEFPLTLGRDFVGTIVQKGINSDSEYKIGDKIWGVVPVQKQGCHSEFISIDSCFVSKKPENLGDAEAAAILYAGLTAYSGIFLTAQLNGLFGVMSESVQGCGSGKKVLVLGASGGVGHLAVQILQAEGAEVLATCGSSAIPLIEKYGISKIIDYSAAESDEILINESPYDVIIDCASKGPEYANSLPWKYKNYVTFKSPLLKNFDDNGLLVGGLINLKAIVCQNVKSLYNNGVVKWGYIVPSKKGISYLKNLAEDGKLVPLIDSKFSYSDMPKAYEKVASGHLRGKVVVEY